MGRLTVNYLSEAQIRGFDHYKYCSVDTSPVAVYISHPFWNQVVKLYPTWLAPNVLTFAGFLVAFSGFFLLSYYDYEILGSSDVDLDHPAIPKWVWLYLSICTFLAHVLDGTDGKQARRTGTSGPTGELFDHGIDSWLTVPFTVCLFSVFGRLDYSISAFRMLLAVMSAQLVFVVTHWEKYNTNLLFLSWGYDISQYFLSIFYLVTYFLGGHKAYKFSMPWMWDLTPANIAELSFYVGCFALSVPMSLYNVVMAYRKGTGKMLSCYEAFLPLVSIVILFGTAIVWALFSPTEVVDIDPRCFMWTVGAIFSNITCRLIIAQMTVTRVEPLNRLLIPFVGVMLTVCVGPFIFGSLSVWELYLLRMLAVTCTFAHLHYAVCVVCQMCEHFNINCFSIKKSHTPYAQLDSAADVKVKPPET